jgi:hypothetical protein
MEEDLNPVKSGRIENFTAISSILPVEKCKDLVLPQIAVERWRP